jgi:large subunit ribosomal protein L7/L12
MEAKFKELVEKIESLSVIELNELVKLLEEKFGVSAAAMVAAAPTGSGGATETSEEKSVFTLQLNSGGANKIAVIKVLKEALGLGLMETKALVDGAPTVLKEGLKKEEAESIKKQIEEAGGQAELK